MPAGRPPATGSSLPPPDWWRSTGRWRRTPSAAGVWVNSADDAAHCTFILPSVHRDGPVSVAVSTGGASPAMASWLRRRLGQFLGPNFGELAELLDEARHRLMAEGRPTATVDWAALLDGPLPSLVRDGDIEGSVGAAGRGDGAGAPVLPPGALNDPRAAERRHRSATAGPP